MDGQRYRCKRQRALWAVVLEMYSLPSVTDTAKLLPELGQVPGFALDVMTADTNGSLWDFDNKVIRNQAVRRVKEEKPMLLEGSHMCTAFLTWQRIHNLIRCPVTFAAEKKRAVEHFQFHLDLCREQLPIFASDTSMRLLQHRGRSHRLRSR